MRILHILDHSIPLHSGYTFRTRAILEQQHEKGWETFHLTSPKHNLVANVDGGEEDIENLHFYRSETPKGIIGKLPVLNQWAVLRNLEKRLIEIIPEIRPDILHAHSPSLNGQAAVRAGKRFGIPVVYEIRAFWEDAAVDHGTSKEWGVRYRMTRALETSVIKNSSAVTTICEGLRNEIITRGVAPDKVTVIPNAVDISRFKMKEEKDLDLQSELGLQDKSVIGFIGSFYAYEGLPLLIKALPEILKDDPDVRLLLVGGGPDEKKINQLIESLGIRDKVILTGRVPHEQVQRYYNLVDIFVYPRFSMRLTELVTPLKPLEAMAQGRLVLASDVGGHRELIRSGENGYLFKAGDVDDLCEKVQYMMTNNKEWFSMKEAGRRFVETERNWEVSVERYRPIYTSLLNARNGNLSPGSTQ